MLNSQMLSQIYVTSCAVVVLEITRDITKTPRYYKLICVDPAKM